jgi:integrase
MASITREADGRRTIQFVGADRKRRSIRLGKISQRSAEAVKVKVEKLVFASITGHAADDETARWLASIDVVMHDKLAAVGLVPKREHEKQALLQDFIDGYVSGRADVKGSTAIVYGHTRRNLIDFFGAGKPLRDITAGDADAFRLFLIGQEKLADNTVRRRCGIAKQFFRAAVRRKLIADNPFTDLPSAVKKNPKRFYFVSREDAQKVIDACPNAHWRLLFALSRYGGLRCPSEHLGLRWGDIDWANNRITVSSPKTEHHEGKESRQIPLFPELRPYLAEVFEAAEPGTEHVITRYRDSTTNLRTTLFKIIKRAGLKPWPKLFQNLRSTRETELAETYPIHVVCEWIGNSQAVAAKHYLQVTDEHFEQAAKAVQNPVQQIAEQARTEPQEENPEAGEPLVFCGVHDDATACNYLSGSQVGDEGLEPPTSTV